MDAAVEDFRAMVVKRQRTNVLRKEDSGASELNDDEMIAAVQASLQTAPPAPSASAPLEEPQQPPALHEPEPSVQVSEEAQKVATSSRPKDIMILHEDDKGQGTSCDVCDQQWSQWVFDSVLAHGVPLMCPICTSCFSKVRVGCVTFLVSKKADGEISLGNEFPFADLSIAAPHESKIPSSRLGFA